MKNTRNSRILNWPTCPNQPKYQSPFHKKSSQQDFIRTLGVKIEAIPILRQQKDWVGGSKKGPFLLTFSTVFMLIRRVGGVQKGQKYANVI